VSQIKRLVAPSTDI